MDALILIAITHLCKNYDAGPHLRCQNKIISCVEKRVKPLDSREYQNKVLLECYKEFVK